MLTVLAAVLRFGDNPFLDVVNLQKALSPPLFVHFTGCISSSSCQFYGVLLCCLLGHAGLGENLFTHCPCPLPAGDS